MKETGIIMSGNHPKLILDGVKLMTRRTWGLKKFNEHSDDWVVHHIAGAEWEFKNIRTLADYHILCPYGLEGCKFWVRETWATSSVYDEFSPSELPKDIDIYYRNDFDGCWDGVGKYRPSLFMPRWASRITLEITEVRTERLTDITAEDILREGVTVSGINPEAVIKYRGALYSAFQKLWDSLNAKRGYGWEKNPWVWVIAFKRIEG